MENNNLSPENVPLISKEETEDDHSTKMESKEQEAEDQSLAGQEHTLPLVQYTVNFSFLYLKENLDNKVTEKCCLFSIRI